LLFGRWRNAALRQRARALEREVALQTRELAEANRRLEHASLTDPLTGLWNRRQFSLQMPSECTRVLRRISEGDGGAALALLLIDCDHFKLINDRHGHGAGDAVLAELAQRLRALAREGDLLLRWGGEEFLLVVRDASRDAVAASAARVVEAINAQPFGPSRLPVTCSVGAACYPFDPHAPLGHGLDQCLGYADAALYRAKRAGRDRAVVAVVGAAPDAPDWIEIVSDDVAARSA
jgi:diguanylate cyclase (GGDEF)-like protein